jgi:hypothetical protein
MNAPICAVYQRARRRGNGGLWAHLGVLATATQRGRLVAVCVQVDIHALYARLEVELYQTDESGRTECPEVDQPICALLDSMSARSRSSAR